MDHTAPCTNRYSLETLRHTGHFIFIVMHHSDERIRAPQQNFTVFVSSKKQMTLTLKFLVKACEVVVFKISDDSDAANRL